MIQSVALSCFGNSYTGTQPNYHTLSLIASTKLLSLFGYAFQGPIVLIL